MPCEVSDMAESDFVARMKEAMRVQGKSQAALAREAGITSQSAVSNIIARTRRVTIDEQANIERVLGMKAEPRVLLVRVIAIGNASDWQVSVATPLREQAIGAEVAGSRAFAVELSADAIGRILPDGGWAIVDPDQTSLFGGRLYLIEDQHQQAEVRRYRSDPARFEPVSTDSTAAPLELDQVRFRVIGRVSAYGHNVPR